MMSEINYAIQIEFTNYTSTKTTYGIVSGIARYITGRPGYAGSPTYPTYENTTNNTHVWYEGFLSFNAFSSPSKRINIDDSGDYGSFSTLNFKLSNGDTVDASLNFANFIKEQSINLIGSIVKFYIVIDDVFYQRWYGLVEDFSNDDLIINVQCIDSFKKVHKTVPSEMITKNRFPELSNDAKETTVPVTLGRLLDAKLYPISEGISPYAKLVWPLTNKSYVIAVLEKVTVKRQNEYYRRLIIHAGNSNTSCVEDQFKGLFLRIFAGKGKGDVYQIDSNSAPKLMSYYHSTYVIELLLNELLITDPADILPDSIIELSDQSKFKVGHIIGTSMGFTYGEFSYCEIIELKKPFVVSQNRIKEFFTVFNETQQGVYSYNEDIKRLILPLSIDRSLDNLNNSGHAGLALGNSVINENSTLFSYQLINGITITECLYSFGSTFEYASSTEIAYLTDRLSSTYFATSTFESIGRRTIVTKLTIDELKGISEYEKVYIGADISYLIDINDISKTHGNSVVIKGKVFAVDIFGNKRSIQQDINGDRIAELEYKVLHEKIIVRVNDSTIDAATFNVNMMPGGIYTDIIADSKEFFTARMDITDFIQTERLNEILSYIEVELAIDYDYSNDGQFNALPDYLTHPSFISEGDGTYPVTFIAGIKMDSVAGLEDGDLLRQSSSPNDHIRWRLFDISMNNSANNWIITGLTFNSGSHTPERILKPYNVQTGDSYDVHPDSDASNSHAQFPILDYAPAGDATIKFRLKQICIVGVKSIDDTDIRTGLNGEVWGNAGTIGDYNDPDLLPEYPTEMIDYLMRQYDGLTDNDITNPSAEHTYWTSQFKLARQITEKKSTKEYITELAQQYLVGVWTDLYGTKAIHNWIHDRSGGTGFTHDDSIIIHKSIQPMDKSPYSKVYTEYTIKYDYDNGTGEFTRALSILKTDQASFPAIDDYTELDTAIAYDSVSKLATESFASIVLPADNQYIVKDNCRLVITSGNAGVDAAINNTKVIAKYYNNATGKYIVIVEVTDPYVSTALSDTTGTLNVYSERPTWTSYVSGLSEDSYGTARDLWGNLRQAYLRIRRINPLPDFLAEAHWIHSQDVDKQLCPHVVQYAYRLIDWCSFIKEKPRYSVPINYPQINLDLLTYVTFNDVKLTNGQDRKGWVTSVAFNTQSDTIEIELTLDKNPDDQYNYNDNIDELLEPSAPASDSIDEQATTTDDIDEDF